MAVQLGDVALTIKADTSFLELSLALANVRINPQDHSVHVWEFDFDLGEEQREIVRELRERGEWP